MKEELQGKLVEILTSVQSAVGKASNFAMAELPDIAQSYIAYGRAVATMWVVFGLLVIIGGWVAGALANKKAGDGFYEGIGYVIGGGCTLVGGTAVVSSISTALLVWLAPKVWLLKEIAGMLK
jgi:hypothetical protein